MNFNGGTTFSGSSFSALGMYAGYLLMQSGNFWIAVCFMVVTTVYFLITVCTLIRYAINYRRNKHILVASAH
jgi:hypothetical protein